MRARTDEARKTRCPSKVWRHCHCIHKTFKCCCFHHLLGLTTHVFGPPQKGTFSGGLTITPFPVLLRPFYPFKSMSLEFVLGKYQPYPLGLPYHLLAVQYGPIPTNIITLGIRALNWPSLTWLGICFGANVLAMATFGPGSMKPDRALPPILITTPHTPFAGLPCQGKLLSAVTSRGFRCR